MKLKNLRPTTLRYGELAGWQISCTFHPNNCAFWNHSLSLWLKCGPSVSCCGNMLSLDAVKEFPFTLKRLLIKTFRYKFIVITNSFNKRVLADMCREICWAATMFTNDHTPMFPPKSHFFVIFHSRSCYCLKRFPWNESFGLSYTVRSSFTWSTENIRFFRYQTEPFLINADSIIY